MAENNAEFHQTAEAMVRKELTKHVRDLVVERYLLGEGYKRISKLLNIPSSTVRAIINKWKKWGTTVTLPRTGRPSKIDKRTRQKPIRGTAERPTATLKELQEYLSICSVTEERQNETEPSSGAEISKCDPSKQAVEEDELDGLPVFGADEEEGELESVSTHKDKRADETSENGNRCSVSPKDNEAGDGVPSSQQEVGPSQNEGSASSQEKGERTSEEISCSPLKKIKDEPIDEDYDKALMSSSHSDISRVKEELENGDHESSVPPDELRISSVFSVRASSDAITAPVAAPQPLQFSAITQPVRPPPIVLQAQMQPHFHAHLQLQPKTLAQLQPHLQTHLQAQLQTHLQPQLQLQAQLQAHLQTQLQPQLPHQLQPQLSHQLPPQLQPQLPPQLQPQTPPQLQPPPQHQPPPAPVRICCSGCSKVLQKGQTAFQKKGSNQLFCSTVCLTGFNLPPAPNIAPKKTCHLCLMVIGNLKDLIKVPVDAANTLKEFCSQSCLSIYKSRVEGLTEKDVVIKCSVCRNSSEIQHEVMHQGVLHRLCSDECFSRFRSSKRLSMSCCESCGNCTVTGNYHLVQIEDAVKKFCSPACISAFKQKSGKRVYCPCCQDIKPMDQMLEGTNTQGVIEFYCSSRCVDNSQASCTLSGASFPCTNCQTLAVPQYHLVMPDGAIRNFCSYDCVGRFQERLQRSVQMNGGYYHSPNTGPHPPVPHHPSAQGVNPPSNAAPASNQNTVLPYVPASRPTNPQDPQQQLEALGPVKLTCKQCQKQFSSKPEVLQFKNHAGLFCSRLCCDMYKREKDVKAVCRYCKEEKVAKEIVIYEKQPRIFCCEGCKLLYKHDYAKQHGGQCRVCAFCNNVTHKTVQNHFGGKLEEFCSEECMSLYTVLFYEMAKCHACKNQGALKESIRWDETVRHFCNLHCLLHFCSKSIIPDKPNSNGINTAVTPAQAPLSLSKDMPVIGGVVSLASALAANTALTGALPTSNASSKIIGDASTQTDAAVNGDPQQRRMLKNKAVMCKPINDEQSIQCDLEPPKLLSDTVIDEKGEKVRLVPVPIFIPTPMYIPVPMHLYTQYTPFPLGLPVPIPVPLVVPASQESAQPSSAKGSVPSQSSVEDEDAEKGKSRPLSHGDQGSTYSGDLESEARSTPFSWADPEDSSHNLKPSVPLSEIEGPKDAPIKSTASKLIDLENDIPLANDQEATKEQKSSVKRRKRGKKGRRRSVTDVASGMVSTPPSSKLHQMYGVKAWASWVQWRTQHADGSPLTVQEDMLNCSSEDLCNALCRFISEARRPNGQTYAPDSVYYLCLGIQQLLGSSWHRQSIQLTALSHFVLLYCPLRPDRSAFSPPDCGTPFNRSISIEAHCPSSTHLLENGRLENIFMDPLYNKFTTDITKMIKDWECTLTPIGFLQSRIEESFLWECKQLGALSPFVLLNTLIFFGVKHLNLKTAEQHQRLSFTAITCCSRSTKHGKSSYLKFRFAGKDEAEKEKPVLLGKRKREDAEENVEYGEMPENTDDPLHCPVRLYEFYLSKCPDSVKESPDVFYLQPESSCHPGSSVWYSTQSLDGIILDSMLSRILAVRDVHLEPKQQQQLSSSDEDTS
ncbi:zinc finger MYM-type protein 4 isoform X2 [Tachysurus fulvidraco]|uniref:zinc finger MYM-type protein 4 isoform X2 n=1 Tax=Tachysurus fulvidraco TaxID=1234273 RepID=UPI001FEF0879|nr:zinc finger MYM-type protein 4 isoform X2 [Tachysurus fulvidraco]